MSDRRSGDTIEGLPQDIADNPDSPPDASTKEADDNATKRNTGVGAPEIPGSVGGTDGVVKNQESDGQ